MYYIIYKITNQINGKIYIGSHKTKNLNDDYMGSGKYLKRSIEKHGVENFSKEILHIFDSPEEMYSKEAELVNEDFISDRNTYNLKVGGFGGFDFINKTGGNIYAHHLETSRRNIKNSHVVLKELRKNTEWMDNLSSKISDALKIYYLDNSSPFKGLSHSNETKDKISKANSISQLGSRNSQFGTMWIHNSATKENKKISKLLPIPDGWVKGRKLK